MEIVWMRDSVTVAEVHSALRSRRLAYTTVMTIMGRLAGKGLLQRTLIGNAYHYSAAQTRKDLVRSIVEGVVDGLLLEFAQPAFTYFVDRMTTADKEALAQLEQLIKERREQQGGG